MNYIDLHCDALTNEGVLQVTEERLIVGGCRAQCLAAFTKEADFAKTLSLFSAFDGIKRTLRAAGIEAVLTVENLPAESVEELQLLKARGVRMAGLVWNYPNRIGFPSQVEYCGRITRAREKRRGLTEFGRDACAWLAENGVLIDVSHGSDALAAEVAAICNARGAPFVASHSDAQAVYDCARNLPDALIRRIADSGGVVGLCFCAAFLSEDRSAAGQRRALLAHASHILRTGGEDVLAIGSDFDGIPENAYIKSPADMPKFMEDISQTFSPRVAEKIFYGNARRVLNL